MNKLEIEDLIKEAKLKFPAGTVFNSHGGYKNVKIPINATFHFGGIDLDVDSEEKQHLGCVWRNKRWAEIVSKPVEQVPEYVECIQRDDNITINKIYKVTKSEMTWCGKNPVVYVDNDAKCNTAYYLANFKPSTLSAYEAQNKPKVMDLLEEAKKRYPIGTEFKCASGYGTGKVIKHPEKNQYGKDKIWFDWSSSGTNGCIYNGGKWAEIVTPIVKEPSKVLIFNDIYVGDIVVCHRVSLTGITSREAGDIYKADLGGDNTGLNYKPGFTSNDSYDWRKATPEEVEAYNKGIRNIKDITKYPLTPKECITPKFVVGKWYKYTSYKDGLYYAKYSSNQAVVDRWYYDERIFTTQQGYKKEHNWSSLGSNPVLLTDLSEIQQYLPNGHVDKIKKAMKLITGEIYYCDKYSNYIFRATETLTKCNNIAFPSTYYKDSGCFDDVVSTCRPATSDEKQWFEACEKANKFIPKEEALKPKIEWTPNVGDWVISDSYETAILKKKTPYQVLELTGTTMLLEMGIKGRLTYGSQNFRKCEPHEIPTSKELELIEGQWYEFEGNGVTNIAKYKKGSSYITTDKWAIKGRGAYGGGAWGKDITNLRLASMEEVYKYFPNEKPSSLELIPGKWYEGLYKPYLKRHIFHFLGLKGDYFHVDKQLDDKLKVSRGDYPGFAGLSSWQDLKLADMEQVYQHFPEERPKQEVMENLVGRYLKALIHSPSGGSVKAGEYGKITHYNGNYMDADFPSQKGYACGSCLSTKKDKYELMPIGWTPDKQEDGLPKTGEYWVYSRSGNHKLQSSDSIYLLTDVKEKVNSSIACKIQQVYQGKIMELEPVTGYTINLPISSTSWRKATIEEIALLKKEPVMNTYGLKVGDKLPQDVLNAYGKKENYSFSGRDFQTTGSFHGDRIIEEFKTILGKTTFQISGTGTVYGKAEGFKEFMEEFNKPKQVVSKFKSGDKVRFISSGSKNAHFFKKGTENLEIHSDTTANGYNYLVWEVDKSNYWGVESIELEAVANIKPAELTSLPKKWFVRWTTSEIVPLVNKIHNTNFGYVENARTSYNDSYIGIGAPDPKGCIEITFEQFKKWVLKTEVKKKPFVVKCTTEKEWDFVKSLCSSGSAISKESWTYGNKQRNYPEGVAIAIDQNSYCGINYWTKAGYYVYSFEEWCKEFGHVFTTNSPFPVGKLEARLEELEKNPRFEIGQKVRCIRPKNRRIIGAGWKEDVQFTIDRIDRYTSGDVLWAAGKTLDGGVYSREVELVSNYFVGHDPYQKVTSTHKKEVSLKGDDDDGLIEPSVRKTRAIKKQLTQQEVVYF